MSTEENNGINPFPNTSGNGEIPSFHGDEKAKALADSRRLLGLSYAALCELEIAYLEKDPAKIEAAMTKVKGTKKEGHKKYTDD